MHNPILGTVDLLYHTVVVWALLAICSVGPGLLLVRRLQWTPVEKLCGSVAASMLVVAQASMAIFWLNLPWIGAMHWGLSAICLAMSAACWRDGLRLWRRRQVRNALGVLGLTWAWTVLLLSLIRGYGGGRWWGDWFEQYQRSVFFTHHGSLDFRFLGQYLITDRPPLMNLICAHYLAQIGGRFVTYQWTAGFLNVLPVLPCFLFAGSVLPPGRRRRAVGAALVLLLISSPMFMQNVTFVWTKSFAAFFALLGLWFYVRGWMKSSRSRIVAGFVFVTAGSLVHLYVGAWLVVMTGHYLLAVWWRREERWKELAFIVTICAVLLASWFGWAIEMYGVRTALRSHLAEPFPGLSNVPMLSRIRINIVSTIVPYFLRAAPYGDIRQKDLLGRIRDLAFYLYQTNAIFAMGCVGAVALLRGMVSRSSPWRRWPPRLRMFWVAILFLVTTLGLCIVPLPEPWGAAHLSLLPQTLLALAVLAGLLSTLPIGWIVAVLIGCSIDFAVGVLLQAHLENRVLGAGAWELSRAAMSNLMLKQKAELHFIGDAMGGSPAQIEIILCVIFAALTLNVFFTAASRRGR